MTLIGKDKRLIVYVTLCVIGWAGAILGDGTPQWLLLVFILMAAGVLILLYPYMSDKRTATHVQDLKQDYFTAFWLWVERYIHRLRHLRESYATYLRKIGSGLLYDYDTHAGRALYLSLSLMPFTSIPVITGEIMTIVVVAAAPIILVYPIIQLWERRKKHAVQVEEEMSFFMCYLTTMQGVGYTLYTALERMRDAPDVFIALSRDAASVAQNVMLGTSHMDALRQYASKHPVPAFKDFLHGYISKHETVGPVPSYTEAKSEQFFESYKNAWVNYKNTAIMLAAMAVMASVMIPVMMVMMVFIAPDATVNLLLTMGPMLGPIFAILILFMVGSAQPSTGVKMKPWLPSLGVGMAVVIIVHMYWVTYITPGGDIWDTEPGVTVSLGFIAAGLSNYIMTRKQITGASTVDRGLPEFLEDIYEQTLAGSAISSIIRQQGRGGLYTGVFGRLLRGIVAQLEMGITMEEACRDARKYSRHLAFVLFVIIRLQELGSTTHTPGVLQQMTRFMSNVVLVKMDVIKSLRMGAIMVYISPILLLGIMNGMFLVFASGVDDTNTLMNILPPGTMEGFSPPSPDSGYRERLGLLAALLTCPMGLAAAKITRFTAVYTIPVVIVATVNLLGIILIPIVIEALPV